MDLLVVKHLNLPWSDSECDIVTNICVIEYLLGVSHFESKMAAYTRQLFTTTSFYICQINESIYQVSLCRHSEELCPLTGFKENGYIKSYKGLYNATETMDQNVQGTRDKSII